MTNESVFSHYKNRLAGTSINGKIRFIAVQYLCDFPGIDPYRMAASLKRDGYYIVFDSAAISKRENERQKVKMCQLAREGTNG